MKKIMVPRSNMMAMEMERERYIGLSSYQEADLQCN